MFRASVLSSAVVTGIVLAACGGGDNKTVVQNGPVTPGCDSSKCLAGNTCLPLDGQYKCRRRCSSNDDPTTSCPFNYTCQDTQPASGVPPFCVASPAPIQQKDSGQWGFPCQANLGSKNPACDSDQGFFCYGTQPTDGAAYCTKYYCNSDAECGAGMECTEINTTPNVARLKRDNYGETVKVCLKRTYCSTCVSDVDCPSVSGTKQHCITDTAGRGFCTPECSSNQNCATEARCAAVALASGEQAKVCYPRATVCVGKGDLCAPCLNDKDCGADGVCTHGEYTTERFCAKKAPNSDCKQCPSTVPAIANRKVACTSADGDNLPAAYCVGVYSIGGTPSDFGCYTPDR